jgi:acyl-CoA thioester hydrolase
VVERLQVRYQDLDPYGRVNNSVYLEYFESVRMAYWQVLATLVDIEELESGDVPGARYFIAETTVRYKASVLFEDTLYAAASIRTLGNRSYVMVFELRAGETFEEGVVAKGSAAHVFYNLDKGEVKPAPTDSSPPLQSWKAAPRNRSPRRRPLSAERRRLGRQEKLSDNP